MSSLLFFYEHTTLFQLFFLVFMIITTNKEVARLSKLENVNQTFISRFSVRCVVMIISFFCLQPKLIFAVSVLSMIAVVFASGFYKDKPADETDHYAESEDYIPYQKENTLFLPIPWGRPFQVLLWVLIDMVAFVILMIVVPWLISQMLPFDKALFERLF